MFRNSCRCKKPRGVCTVLGRQDARFFEHAKVEIISGDHPDGNMLRYEAKGGFEALARMKSDHWRSFEGRMELSWEHPRTDDGAAGGWQITGWKTTEMHWRASPRRLFVEALDTAMHESQEASMLRRSLHYEATVKHYRDGAKQLPHPYFAPISANQKEGIAVADVNGDGFDDIYITMRLGKNMLLVNQGDGTFLEQAASFKLDLPGHTTCALFADFDNDGDQDLLVGGGYGWPQIVINSGSDESPRYENARRITSVGTPLQLLRNPILGSPLSGHNMGYPYPVLVDWDADGRPDLLDRKSVV